MVGEIEVISTIFRDRHKSFVRYRCKACQYEGRKETSLVGTTGCPRCHSRVVGSRLHTYKTSDRRSANPLYATWMGMRQRVNNPNNHNYSRYGGRGIKICPQWDDFWVFVKDVGARPPGMTLDREDNDGDYTPQNCRWATPRQQRANQEKPLAPLCPCCRQPIYKARQRAGLEGV